MARTGAFLGAAAILALGGFAALPDDEPQYLGDMPSSLQQPAAEGPPAPRSDPGPAAGGPPPPVRGPAPVVPEAPGGVAPGPGDRQPDAAGDTALDFVAGSTAGDDSQPPAGVLDPVTGLVTGVVDAVGGLVDCVLQLPTCLGAGLPVPTLPVPTPTLPVEIPDVVPGAGS